MSISLSAGSFEFTIFDPLIIVDGKELCVASFYKTYTIFSSCVSFIVPGLLIIVANIGILVLGGKLLRRDRKRTSTLKYSETYAKYV